MSSKKRPPKKTVTVNFKIANIELIASVPSLPVDFDPNVREGIRYKLTATVNSDNDASLFSVVVHYNLYSEEQSLYKLDVKTDYKIRSGFEGLQDNDFIRSLIQLAIHHARGVQALQVQHTPLSEFYIPQVDASKLVAKEGE